MDGEVIGIANDKCAVRAASGITIFKIFCWHDTDLGDVISGNLEGWGIERLVNETRDQYLDVFIEDRGCSSESADRWLRRWSDKRMSTKSDSNRA